MKLGLGTVQFGQAYGVTNERGVTPTVEAHAVLRRAVAAGIRVVDTAPRYGDAQRVVGAFNSDAAHELQVVTKTPAYADRASLGECARASLHDSLAALNRHQAYAWLEHSADELLGPDGDSVWAALSGAKDDGRVVRIGVSVYTAEQLDALLERFTLDIVQLPANVLDRRLLEPERLARLHDRGIEVHVRSTFLQGALLAAPERVAHIAGLGACVSAFHATCDSVGCSRIAGALAPLLSNDGVDVVLVGVEDTTQLGQILGAAEESVDIAPFARLASNDPAVVDPRGWRAR